MHIQVDARLILVLSLLSITRCSSDDGPNDGAVMVGYGYSSVSRQVSHQACFNASVARITDRTTRLELGNPLSASELQRIFGADSSSQDAKANYLRDIQEDESSVSLNYYVVSQEDVTVNINGLYDQALNNYGKQVYHSLNKNFGLLCGDNYIASYNQGAALILGFKIVLNSKEDKAKLEGGVGVSYGPLVKVPSKIQSVCNQNNISCTIQTQAFQYGGNPVELVTLLSKDIVSCDMKDVSGCEKVGNDLLSYAKEFGNQIKNVQEIMALGNFDYIPIERLGLEVTV